MNGPFRALLVASIVVGASPAFAQFAAQRDIDYPTGGVQLGQAWSTITSSKVLSTCIEFEEASDPAESKTLDIQRVYDRAQLNRKTSVNAEFQAKGILGAGATAKAEFARDVHFDSESLMLVLTAVIRRGPHFVAPKPGAGSVRIKSDELALLQSGKVTEFLTACGDGFVSTIYEGGDLRAVLEFSSLNQSQRQRIAAAASGSWGVFRISANASSELDQASQQQRLHIWYHAAGGQATALPISEMDLLERVRNFDVDVAKAPYKIAVTVVPYSTLPDWPNIPLPTAQRLQGLEELVAQFQRYKTLREDIDDAILRPTEYSFIGNISVASIGSLRTHLTRKFIDPLRDQIRACTQGTGSDCSMPSELATPVYNFAALVPLRGPAQEYKNWEKQYNDAMAQYVPTRHTYRDWLNAKLDVVYFGFQSFNALYPQYIGEQIYQVRVLEPALAACNDPFSKVCLTNDQLTILGGKALAATALPGAPVVAPASSGPVPVWRGSGGPF